MKLFPNYSKYIVTSPFGMRTHPVTGKKTMHNGIDLVASNGGYGSADYIATPCDGTVESVGYNASCGYYVNIRSGNLVMAYYHLKENAYVKKGATVKAGDKIGYMGMTGTATGVHLHWGIKQNGSWIDPKPYLEKYYSGTSGSNETTKGGNTVNIEMNVLAKGSKGEQVKTLQRLLMAYGYSMGVYGADGSFGNTTDKAVRAFQKAKGLTVDGSVGKNTWEKLLKG